MQKGQDLGHRGGWVGWHHGSGRFPLLPYPSATVTAEPLPPTPLPPFASCVGYVRRLRTSERVAQVLPIHIGTDPQCRGGDQPGHQLFS